MKSEMAPVSASVGRGSALDGREAVTQAIHNAFKNMDRRDASLAIIIASHEYNAQQVLNGAMTQLGDTAILGFSSSGEIAADGSKRRSIVVALIDSDGLMVNTSWLSGFTNDVQGVTQELARTLQFSYNEDSMVLLVADGLTAEADKLCKTLPFGRYSLAGCLAGGDLRVGRTYQIGGTQAGSGGVAAAILSGDGLQIGVGVAHGWSPVGAYFQVTAADGPWVRELDEYSAAETYSQLFGYQPREWSIPPLNTLVRLYPLGIENGTNQLQIRAPLRVELDGSFRMGTTVDKESICHLMVGSKENCLDAARLATEKALSQLDGARPVLALVFTDVAWQFLLEGQLSSEVRVIQDVLGAEVPIAGGYTFGQIARSESSDLPEFLNQHIEVIIFGEIN
jgi:hypothetical protein